MALTMGNQFETKAVYSILCIEFSTNLCNDNFVNENNRILVGLIDFWNFDLI